MSVLIKGMNIPQSCMDCKLTDSENCTCVLKEFYNDEYYVGCFEKGRAPWCPLVEVPTHGRLKDADELKELFRETITGIATRTDMKGAYEHMIRASAMVIEMIDDAPTVIEASEVDNES